MARKKGLPFVVKPRLQSVIEQIGTEESGIIEIERKGYLSVAEKAIVQGVTSSDDSLKMMFALAARIGRENGKQQNEVAKDIMESTMPEYLEPYQDEVSSCLMNMVEFQERTLVIQATALLMCRVQQEWSVDQTMELHPDLIAALGRLYNDEEKKDVEILEQKQSPNAATKGKP